MNVTDQLDRQLRATNVAKLGMRLSCVETRPALKLFLGLEATPLDLRHNRTELDALCKVEHFLMMSKRRTKKIWSSNLGRKLKSCVMMPDRVMRIRSVCLLRSEKWVRKKLRSFMIRAVIVILSGQSW